MLTAGPPRPVADAPTVGHRLRDWALFALLLASIIRLVAAGFSVGAPAWFSEELPPLVRLFTEGEPITHIDPRQYGVVVFLVFDLVVRGANGAIFDGRTSGIAGPGVGFLSTYALFVSFAAVIGAFALCWARFLRGFNWRLGVAAAIVWLNFTPLLYVVAQRIVDAWQLLFLSAALYFFTGTRQQRRFAAVPLAFASLTKLLPTAVFGYVFLRDRRAGLVGVAIGLVLLAIGQVLYGYLMGFGYPFAILGNGGSTVGSWSSHYENNSLRGLIFKVAAGFRLVGESREYALAPGAFPVLSLISYAVVGAIGLYLLWVAWISRREESSEHRAAEFSLAIATMLIVSPHTAHDYTVALLPAYTVFAWLWLRRRHQWWNTWLSVSAIASALLVGVFLPVSLVARIIPFETLIQITGNIQNDFLLQEVGTGIGAYHFYGFPGYGLLLAWAAAVAIERKTRLHAIKAREDEVVPVGQTVVPKPGARVLRGAE